LKGKILGAKLIEISNISPCVSAKEAICNSNINGNCNTAL